MSDENEVKSFLRKVGEIEVNDILTSIPEGDTCEVCGLTASVDFAGLKYCEDCYETEILHQWSMILKKKT